MAPCQNIGGVSECTVQGSGNGLVCSGAWSFDGAVADEDCMGAQLSVAPCAGAGAVSFRVTAADVTIRRPNQPGVTLPRDPTCGVSTQCSPAPLEGCWADVTMANRRIRIDAPTPTAPGRWVVGGTTYGGLVCSGRRNFTGAQVDDNCMGVQIELDCLPRDDHPAVFRLGMTDQATIQRVSGANHTDLERRPASECPQ